MKISVITVVYNSAHTIADALNSVAQQTYSDIEHIVIDGGSSDGTVSVIESHRDALAHFVSEPDNGIYDAMNKGLRLASGDVIGFLNADDVYAHNEVLSRMYGDLAKLSNTRQFKPRGGILITCPTAQTPYHCDPTDTILWHVHGHKRLYLYPDTAHYLPDEAYERVLYCDNEDYLPYNKMMEQEATAYDLTGDDMISWPLNMPHRVENMSYCVSVTTEFSTPESSFKNAVMYSNAVLRQKFGMNPQWRGASMTEKLIKAGAGRIMRKMSVLASMKQTDIVTFKVDKRAPNFILDTAPFARNF